MSRRYCVIKENQKMRTLLSIIKSNYNSDNKDSLQEVNLEHVLNRIFDQDIKVLVKNAWKDLEIIAGQEIRLLENNCKKNFINRLYKKTKDMNFIIKAELNDETAVVNFNSKNNLKLEHKYINI
ncbi:normocyte binding protein 2b [Francisella tularensis subsp. novicida]|uniref:normocyte binding protein 2b n=1 Tax=Francisella tularensis TaxID=263 RepID=UPI000CE2B2EF|nr:normocyte binding protein 2b [Francisella tularensis]AVC44359.1 normocyte binding protein 2b [Francisella tularensis subsp. novicida]